MLSVARLLQRRTEKASEMLRSFRNGRQVAARFHVGPCSRGLQCGNSAESILVHLSRSRKLPVTFVAQFATRSSKQLPLPSRSFPRQGRRKTGSRSCTSTQKSTRACDGAEVRRRGTAAR